jgi:hypothetical protein
MSYTILLVVLAIRAQGRGNSPWTTGVRDGVLFYSVRKTTHQEKRLALTRDKHR